MPFLNNEGLEVVKEIFNSKFAGKNADGAVVSVGADYAEFADWADGNPDGAERKGHFVTVVSGSNDIEIANSASAITGVITDSAGFIGNYSKGAESDASKGLVGIIGQITVIDNGTCEVGQRCMPADDGTAVPSENTCGYKVIDRVDANHVKIMVAPALDMIQRIRTDVGELQDGAYCTLGLGTSIPEGADLNSYITPGVYDVYNGAIAKTLLNRPSDSYGTLRVYLASDVVCQEYITGLYGLRYHRRMAASGTWNDWTTISTINPLSLDLGDEIHDNDNLNDYKTYGVYRITSNATLQTLTGRPDSNCLSTACTLVVRAGHISGQPIQEIISRVSGNRAIRQFDGSKWSAWAFYGGTDSIIAGGISGDWRYWKFANGLVILKWYEASKQRSWTKDTTYGNINYTVNLSTPFTVKQATVCGTHSASRYVYCGLSGAITTITGGTNCYLAWMQEAQTQVQTGELNVTIIGYWK